MGGNQPKSAYSRRNNDTESLETDSTSPEIQWSSRRIFGRISSDQGQRGPSFLSRWRRIPNEEDGQAPVDPPPIPNALQSASETYTTPLPTLSMVVLSIAMLGEFLSANVSTPFLLFMVKGFGAFTEKAEIAFWTGILVSTFFLTQFLTSLLWATVADKHGQRLVLFTSLLGSAITCLMFGTSTSLKQAIVIRLLQGIFAGAVGVARGCVTNVTDTSNEGRAYAILGFCWGFGGVAGAIIGGSFESPAEKWPKVFDKLPVFVNYPYILPCALAASITLLGSVLSLFLGRDGGPRGGAIRLPPEKFNNRAVIPQEPESPSPFIEESPTLGYFGSLKKRLSDYLPPRSHDTPASLTPPTPVPLSSVPRSRNFPRTSRVDGSAYGYSANYRNRLGRTSFTRSMRRRGDHSNRAATPAVAPGELNFAQRLLMANENAVTNIADLWVASAMNVDNDESFESDSELESDAASESDDDVLDFAAAVQQNYAPRSALPGDSFLDENIIAPPIPSSQRGVSPPFTPTRVNVLSSRRGSSAVPSIFSHPGVRTPRAIPNPQRLLSRVEYEDRENTLPAARGKQRARVSQGSTTESLLLEKPPSLTSQLPLQIILQYGLLALHSTTHDQVFLSYLVSDYGSGGLNLNAGHFAQLIALMCLAQISYQFYLYPNIGPPRGRFSHMSMFRLGSLLFIPSYLTVTLYRVFASSAEDGNFVLMTALAVSTALRYCGTTFAYTSIAILLNYMTPPGAVGYANGLAQSIVSLARCFGPVLGGYLWSVSVENDPSGYPLGFIVCAGVCAVAVAASFIIR